MPQGQEDDKLVRPRPGHADLPGIIKYGFETAREVIERSSARETAARVAVGAVATAFLEQAAGIVIESEVISFGEVSYYDYETPDPLLTRLAFEAACQELLDSMGEHRDTVGGTVETKAYNVPPGLGSYISADQRLDAALSASLVSIPAVKGVDFGIGYGYARVYGSEVHDKMFYDEDGSIVRETNRAGGIEGGISNGSPIITSIVVKPIPSVPNGLETVNLATGQNDISHPQRSDLSAVFPARSVAKAMVALTLADFLTKRYGQDRLDWIQERIAPRGVDYSEEVLDR
jgi:chorismate synthase